MTYLLQIKKVEVSDTTRECPYLSTEEEFEKKLIFLIGSINDLDDVSDVKYSKNIITIKLKTPLAEDDLREKMKVYFIEVYCYYRYVSLAINK